MCAKLRTVAASNNRDHAPQSLLLLLARARYIMVLSFTHIPFVVNHIINPISPERLQHKVKMIFFFLGGRSNEIYLLKLKRNVCPPCSTSSPGIELS